MEVVAENAITQKKYLYLYSIPVMMAIEELLTHVHVLSICKQHCRIGFPPYLLIACVLIN